MLFISNFMIVLLGAAFIGACFGSLINVVVYRLPKMMERQWSLECIAFLQSYFRSNHNATHTSHTISQEDTQAPHLDNSTLCNETFSDSESTQKSKPNAHDPLECLTQMQEKQTLQVPSSFNLCIPRSHCPACGTMIPLYRNIPIFTWLIQRGRAHCCGTRIAAHYFWIEFLGALLVVAAIAYFGLSIQGVLGAIFLLALLTLAAFDLKTRLLPDSLTLPLLWLGLTANLFHQFSSLPDAVLGSMLGYLILWLLYQAHFFITRREGMGFGDFKLAAAFGAWLGWKAIPLILFIAAIIGLIVAVCSIRVRNNPRFEAIAFGPSLCISAAIVLFYGQILLEQLGY